MAPFGKIFTYPNNIRVHRVLIMAEMNGLEIEVPPFDLRKDNRTPEFLAKFPLGKIPSFEGADGFCLSESIAIAQYVAQSGPKAGQLLGTDAKSQALILKWAQFSETELFSNIFGQIGMTVLKVYTRDKIRYEDHANSFTRAIKSLEASLQDGQKYLVGDGLTMADLMVASVLFVSFQFLLDAEWRKEIPKTVAYTQAFFDVPEHKKYFGKLEFCETRDKFE
ncbi:glutathione S-transferase [Xylaria intraflava]|nr:glutathione S-transferase [Xylaria intraflava]